MNELILPRRKFLIGTATLLGNLYVGPTIVKASSLMDIDSMRNRMVVAFRWKGNTFIPDKGRDWLWSYLNMNPNPLGLMEKWSAFHRHCYEYDFVRRENVIIVDTDAYRNPIIKKEMYETILNEIREGRTA